MNLVSNLQSKLYQPVDIAFLVYFRIVAGVLMAFEFAVYFYSRIGEFTQTGVNFTYLFFDGMPHWSATGFYLHVTAIVVLSLLVAVGFYYRVTVVLLFLAQLTLFLMEKSIYQNHIYLFWLVCLLMIFLPAHRAFSYDVRRRPDLQTTQTPVWTWYLLLFQISVVYFYAGIAKLYGDWWEARPMIIWLFHKRDYPVIGGLLGSEWFPYFVSYAGVIFDLTIVPLLLFRKTRKFGFALALVFHVFNAAIFGAG